MQILTALDSVARINPPAISAGPDHVPVLMTRGRPRDVRVGDTVKVHIRPGVGDHRVVVRTVAGSCYVRWLYV